jgi:hypothetical protein
VLNSKDLSFDSAFDSLNKLLKPTVLFDIIGGTLPGELLEKMVPGS